MAGLLTRFRSVFGSNNTRNNDSNPLPPTGDSIEVCHPSTFSILTAQYGFYSTILGNIDDQKPLSLPQKLVLTVVEKSLADQQKRIKAVPRLPSVIPRLLQSLRDPKSSATHYVQIINKDPAMSTAVLKLANSAYFNPIGKRITSIETAVVKLGIEGLRTVLSAAVMQPVIQRKSYYYTEFGHKLWTHALCCAVACEQIAKQRGLEPFKAYLLGLVHDIGKITIFSELSSQFQLNQNQEQNKPGYAAFAPLMQSTSETLSHTVAKDWSLPEEICSALAQQINLTAGKHIGPYAHILYQANLICEIYAIAKQDDTQMPAAEQALQDMALPDNLFKLLDSISVQL
ncbi:HDOD domain-containing protein [Oceanicoccus sp. KOV_DT_Chl]|uniref:HDOD domain-containing protein n=1 Tax=Oceanicoccus sp. KOV_DT_Chl TaxID=1904639 RepID=UPI000C7BE20F|nr:HDOD domain-containing protein [Oceanicoccus sp. KOV_DT_Chl]